MTNKLRLGPLPKTETVKLTIALSTAVKADLDHYAEIYGAAYGETINAATIAPHMLAAFMDRDRAFRQARHSDVFKPRNDSRSISTRAAVSNTNETASDNSASG